MTSIRLSTLYRSCSDFQRASLRAEFCQALEESVRFMASYSHGLHEKMKTDLVDNLSTLARYMCKRVGSLDSDASYTSLWQDCFKKYTLLYDIVDDEYEAITDMIHLIREGMSAEYVFDEWANYALSSKAKDHSVVL